MATRDIRPSVQDTICDVCGRTLLRGERAEVYLDGQARRQVCELCKDRALHEGWVREGTVTGYEDAGGVPERRRSLLSRLRSRRDGAVPLAPPTGPTLRDDLDGHAWSEANQPPPEAPPPPRPRRTPTPRSKPDRGGIPLREPRHVRAVPTSAEQKVVTAAELFNQSEHPRTVAGVARSLGAPAVAVIPSPEHASLVSLVVSWELCWYRYEVDLSDDEPSVRPAGQGYELSELAPAELQGNAVADERGRLVLAG
jgi:hypothetical protein